MKKHVKNNRSGFTLIEVIVSLVVAAIMASMIYTYFGNALTQSSVPIFRLQKASKLHQVMENIVTDFNRLNKINLRYKWRSAHDYQVGDIVLPSNLGSDNINSKIDNNGRYYICTAAGESGSYTGANQPPWTVTTPPGIEFSDGTGTLRWKEWGYVRKSNTIYSANTIIVPAINNGHFYKCTTGGTSGATEPTTTAWLPTTLPISGTSWPVTDNTCGWTEAGTILDNTFNNDNLMNYLSDENRYDTKDKNGVIYENSYDVFTTGLNKTGFVKFNGTTMVDVADRDERSILRVTIESNDSAETLTQIFTIR